MEEKELNRYDDSQKADEEKSAVDKKDKRRYALAEVMDWFDTVIGSITAIIIIFALVTRLSTVDGDSMNPTLIDKERLFVTNFMYAPERNDIVVVWTDGLYNEITDEYGKAIVKRVIGVAGDTVKLDTNEGAVYVNGEKLSTEIKDGVLYEDGHMIMDYTKANLDMYGEITVPEGYVFVMGDNRNNSIDSRDRDVGLVDVNEIIGKAYLRVAPLERFGGV